MLSKSVKDNKELANFLKDYERLSNNLNFDEVAPFIADDAVYWFSDGTHRGIGEIRRAFEKTWQHIQDEKYTIDNVEWLVNGTDHAVCIYQFHSDGMVGGKHNRYSGRGTNIFKKMNGKWKIVHEHLSKMK